MSILFLGGEMAAFVPSDGSVTELSDSNYYDSSFSRAAVDARGSTSAYFESPALSFPDTFYVHFAFHRDTTGNYSQTLLALRTSTTDVFRITADGSNLQMQALVSGVWTNVGSAVSYSQSYFNHVDLYVSGNSATGTATLFIAGTQRASATADLSAVVSVATLLGYGTNARVSQVIVADEPTIGWRLLTRYPSGAGATSSWTGAYTDIDEAVYNDADFILSATANQISTFAQTGPAISGYLVQAVGVYARAKRGASGPSKIRPVIRVAGTDYPSGSDISLSVGYQAVGAIWETNPATSADWVNTAIDALQPGVKSIT